MKDHIPKHKVHIDEQLFERICMGEQDAFQELYEASCKPLYAFLLSYTLNAEDAQDLLQETYLQILKNCQMYRKQGNPMAWMMKIAKNIFLMQYRKEKERNNISLEETESALGFQDISNTENRIVLEKMFALLSEEERNIIIMHDVNGLKHRETAKLLDLPLGTVLAKYHRGIRKLQKEFGERL